MLRSLTLAGIREDEADLRAANMIGRYDEVSATIHASTTRRPADGPVLGNCRESARRTALGLHAAISLD